MILVKTKKRLQNYLPTTQEILHQQGKEGGGAKETLSH
jgi:hypothetical protein